jgi:hypothetical protein
MRESRTYGFVRGVLGDQHPYRDSQPFWFEKSLPVGQRKTCPIAVFWRKLVGVMLSPPGLIDHHPHVGHPRSRPPRYLTAATQLIFDTTSEPVGNRSNIYT